MKKIFTLAVLALMGVGSALAQTTVFSSDFSYAPGTGGVDGTFTGTVATTKIQSSNATSDEYKDAYATFLEQWVNSSLSNAYWANKSIKLGTSSKDGVMTSVELGEKMTDFVKVTINAAGWGSGSNSMTLASSNGSIADATVTLGNGEFKDYSFNIQGGDATTAITISGRRLFVKSVTVETASAPSVNKPTITGDATFDANTTVTITADEGTTIYYTLDESDPTFTDANNFNGVVYTSAINVTKTTTIKAIAVKGADVSGISSSTFTRVLPEEGGTAEQPLTVAQAIEFINTLGTISSKEVHVKGIISQIDSYNSQYNSIQYWISDDGTTSSQLEVYSGKGLNGANFTAQEDIALGATVVVKGILKKYGNIYEFDKNNEQVSYDASTVGISSVKAAAEFNGAIYNIAGQKVSASYKGLVIKNGKKIVQK